MSRSLILIILLSSIAEIASGQSNVAVHAPSESAGEAPGYSNSIYSASTSPVRDGYSDSQDAAASYSAAIDYFPGHLRAAYNPQGDYRQPVSIEFVGDSQAIISTKLSGELLVFDALRQTIQPVFADTNRQWGQVLGLGFGTFAVIDQAGSNVAIWERNAEGWGQTAELDCPGTPHSLAWECRSGTLGEGVLYVSGQWSQRLYRFQNAAAEDKVGLWWSELPAIDLPMCAGVVLPLPKHHSILVMDAFGRDYAVVDQPSASVVKHDQVYGHNVSQIVAVDDEQRVLYTHQLLNEFVRSTRSEITWGGMISNNMRWLQTERLLRETGSSIFAQGKFIPIGVTGDGAGDPTSFSLSGSGHIAITLGGTDRVAIADLTDLDFTQIDVGYRPVDCSFTADDSQLVVVNQFSDNLSIISMQDLQVTHLPLGELREPTQVERGERFFFHSKIAHDNWMSCHSCHSQGHTNGQLNDNLTDETFGTPKRILSLLGVADTSPYGWSGRFDDLEQQIEHSIRSTMATDHGIRQETIADLAAYLRTLSRPPSVAAARGSAQPREQQQIGRQLFAELGCADCHSAPSYTSRQVVDVGLVDEAAMNLFNPPSLIAISQRQNALLHDGRARSVDEVFSGYQHQLPRELSEAERECLIQYLLQL